jgi:hypothetical protein
MEQLNGLPGDSAQAHGADAGGDDFDEVFGTARAENL